jgi:hypothetical protein
MNIVERLKASGCISEIEGPNPSQPIYVITDLGRKAIAGDENPNRTG